MVFISTYANSKIKRPVSNNKKTKEEKDTFITGRQAGRHRARHMEKTCLFRNKRSMDSNSKSHPSVSLENCFQTLADTKIQGYLSTLYKTAQYLHIT